MKNRKEIAARAADEQGSAAPRAEESAGGGRLHRLLIAAAILMGAFLLFQVQLIMGKQILPWFGGTPGVWTACMLFFQVLLLGGYTYANYLAVRLGDHGQRSLHVSLLALSLALLTAAAFVWPSPITPDESWKPQGGSLPTLLILQFLLATVGLPFFLLSSTSPLLQHWFSKEHAGLSPYRLYSLSNLGSLLGLLTYPFLVEPALDVRAQSWIWYGGYAVFALLVMAAAPWKGGARGAAAEVVAESDGTDAAGAPGWKARGLWVAWATCGSVLLLATTNVISQQVAVIPFLWVLPLSLYLVSFILCFEYPRMYRRNALHIAFAITAGLAFAVQAGPMDAPWAQQLMAYVAVLFAACMVCHGEIAVTKPHPRHLTGYYVCISAGGALGGVLVSIVAPRVFPNLWEFPLGVLATGGLLLMAVAGDHDSWWHRAQHWLPAAAVAGTLALIPRTALLLDAPLAPPAWFYYSAAAVLGLTGLALQRMQGREPVEAIHVGLTRAAAVAIMVVLGVGFAMEAGVRIQHSVARSRNFYGILAVLQSADGAGRFLYLRDRMVVHGMQYSDPRLARLPVGYYGQHSGIHMVLRNLPARPVRIGVVGLGTGSLAAFSRPGDVYRFYEINPAVLELADGPGAYFTYLRDAAGTVEASLGDARLCLEREAAAGQRQRFDVLILDAFSGDAIPIHLLTREAFALYLEHLRAQDSMIAVHITNRGVDLGPVLASLAKEFGFASVRINRPWLGTMSAQTDWVLLSRSPGFLAVPEIREAGSALPAAGQVATWTDAYSNLFRVLK
jgi:spermidine synthase